MILQIIINPFILLSALIETPPNVEIVHVLRYSFMWANDLKVVLFTFLNNDKQMLVEAFLFAVICSDDQRQRL